MIDLISTM